MNLDRRIANAVKRLHGKIDEAAGEALWYVGIEGKKARDDIHEAFNTAARSLGQVRRWRVPCPK